MNLTETPLSGLASVSAGGPAPQGPDAFGSTGHPFVRAGSLAMLLAGADESSLEHLDATAAKKHGLRLFPAGAILFAKSGMSATKGLVYRLKQPAYVVSHLAVLIPHDERDGAFMARALQFFSPTRLIRDAAYPSIRLEDVGQMRIPVPVERGCRTRIAEILDQADALRAKRRAALAQVDGLTQAIFLEMFGDPASNRWPVGQIGDLVRGFESGRSFEAAPDDASGGCFRVLKVSAVTEWVFRGEESKPVPQDYAPPPSHVVRRGDLLFSRANTSELIGAVAFVTEACAGLLLPDKLWRFLWHEPPMADAEFVRALFRTPGIRREISRRATGTSGSMKNISQEKVLGIPTVIPPLSLQRSFAARAAAVDELKASHRASLAQLDALFASLQHRAFRGEL